MSAKRVDFTAIIFIGVLLSALFYITATKNIGFFVVAIFFAIAFDFPHGLHTYFRIATDPEEFKLYKSEFWWSFIIIFFVSAYLIYFRDYKSLITIWVLWQLFHVYKQHIGMIALYARKASYKVSNTLPKVVLFLGCFSPILYRVYNKGFFFGDYHFFGIPLPFSGLVIDLPTVSIKLVEVSYILFSAAAVALIWQQLQLRVKKQSMLPSILMWMIPVVIASYNMAYIMLPDLYSVLLVSTSIHALQYHLICWAYNKGKYKLDPLTSSRSQKMVASLLQPKKAFFYFLVLIVGGWACSLSEFFMSGLIPLTLVLHHFYLDGIVWRTQTNPKVGEFLVK